MKITVGWLDSRKEARNRPRERHEVPIDGHQGLYAWVYPSGVVVFVYRYTPPSGGNRKKMRLGEYGNSGITLAEAFDLHRDAQRELEKGLDPIEERDRRDRAAEDARRERSGADTVASVVEQFVHRKLRAERWDVQESTWVRDAKTNTKARKRPDEAAALLGYAYPDKPPGKRKDKRRNVPTVLSEFGEKKARDITRRDLVAFLDGIVDRCAPVTANRVYSLLKQMFAWAAAKDIIPSYPMLGMERPGGDEKPRKRVLTEDEIRAFWSKLDTAEMAEPTKLALKLLLVTAQRRGEVTGAKWSEFDIDGKTWTIPVARLKSSHSRRETIEPHVVPLSHLAIELLEKLKRLTGGGVYLLPAWANKKKANSYSERVLSRAVRENAKHFGIPHFTPHDLRRTAASFMTKRKIPRLHVEKVLNHSTGDIAEVYDRHDYLAEKREALERWSAHLTQFLAGSSNIVPIDRERQRA
jgi:integrase